MVHVGGIVTVIDNEQCYSSYEEWVNRHAPEYRNRWKKHRVPTNGNPYEVVTIADHEWGNGAIYGIFNKVDGYFVVDVTAFV